MIGIVDSLIDVIHRPAPVKASQEEIEGPPMIRKVDLPPGAEIIIRERDLEGGGLLVQPVTAVERGLSEGAASVVCRRGKIVREGPIEPFLAEDGQFVAIRPFPKKPYPNPNVFRVCVQGDDEVLIKGYEGPEITRAIEPLTAVRIKDPDLAVQAQGVINSDRPVVGKPLPPDLESLVYSVLVANIPVTEEVLAGQRQEPFNIIYQGTRARVEQVPQKVETVPTPVPAPTPEPTALGAIEVKADTATTEAPVATIERGNKFGVVSILELEPVKTVVETGTGEEKQRMPQLITPFMGLDYGTQEKPIVPPVMVIGYTIDGQIQEFRGVNEKTDQINDPIQLWRALKMLSKLPLIRHSTLYDVLHAAGEDSVKSARSIGDLGREVSGFADLRTSIRTQVPTAKELETILGILKDSGVIIDLTELRKEVDERRIARTDLIDEIIGIPPTSTKPPSRRGYF